MRLSLRARLTLWFATSLLLIAAPFVAVVLVLEWRSVHAALDHHLREDLEVASEMLVLRDGGIAWRTNRERDLGYDAGRQRWVEAYGETGRPLLLRGYAAEPAIRSTLAAPSIEGFRTFRTPAGANVRALSTKRAIGGAPVWIRVVRSEDRLHSDLMKLFVLFSIVTPLVVLGAAVAGYAITDGALAPLGRMAERARSISADRLSERLPVENDADELGQLAVVFNETFARLETSFERLKQFTADASHELRTPLAAIRSVGEVGLRESHGPADYRDVIGSMLEESDRLTGMVDRLLTLSRWESGRVRPIAEVLDMAEVASAVAGQLSVLADERDVILDVDLPQPLVIKSDRMMLRAAFTNVLDNAIKFTPRGGRVRMFGRPSDREHQVVIDDNGPGIPAEQRTRVLERFHRVDAARDREHGGAGIGLAITYRAMTVNGGRVVIDSNDAGGARVVLALPRPSAHPQLS